MQLTGVSARQVGAAIEAGRQGSGPPYRRDVPVVEGLIDGFPRALLKLKPRTLSEIWGYQLAAHLGLRVPRCAGLWITEDVRIERPEPEPDMRAGDFGLLVEELADWQELEERDEEPAAVALDAETVGRAFCLRAFDSWEAGVFGVSGGRLFYVDLEGTLLDYGFAFCFYDVMGRLRPTAHVVETGELEHARAATRHIRRAGRLFAESTRGWVDREADKALALGVLEPMIAACGALRRRAQLPEPLLRLTGHPRARPLRAQAERALRRRLPVVWNTLAATYLLQGLPGSEGG